MEVSFRGEGFSKFAAYGENGGLAGANGDMKVMTAEGTFTPPAYGMRRTGPARLSQVSPGGGGLGEPFERDAELVLRDVRDGVVSRGLAVGIYGGALSPDGRSVDAAATARIRTRAAHE